MSLIQATCVTQGEGLCLFYTIGLWRKREKIYIPPPIRDAGFGNVAYFDSDSPS